MPKGNHMRYSKQREAILQIVQMNPVHPTADWVYERVKKTVPNISLGTVYRNLNQLVETKAITAIRCDNTIHYDGNTNDHSHFICDICNRIYDLEQPVGGLISTLYQNCQHNITGLQIQLSGICENCKTPN